MVVAVQVGFLLTLQESGVMGRVTTLACSQHPICREAQWTRCRGKQLPLKTTATEQQAGPALALLRGLLVYFCLSPFAPAQISTKHLLHARHGVRDGAKVRTATAPALEELSLTEVSVPPGPTAIQYQKNTYRSTLIINLLTY